MTLGAIALDLDGVMVRTNLLEHDAMLSLFADHPERQPAISAFRRSTKVPSDMFIEPNTLRQAATGRSRPTMFIVLSQPVTSRLHASVILNSYRGRSPQMHHRLRIVPAVILAGLSIWSSDAPAQSRILGSATCPSRLAASMEHRVFSGPCAFAMSATTAIRN